MKKLFPLMMLTLFLISACDSWGIQPQPFPAGARIPSRTPGVITATPIILTLPFTETITTNITLTNTETPSPTAIIPTETPTITPIQSVTMDILGCNTSIDITHGMGEVTNAYVTVKNTGNVDLPNACALLRAGDEDRTHPDKKACLANLPAQNQVTFKLTVDSAYKQDTVIQVDASTNGVLLLRVDKPSCTDIGLFGSEPSDLGVIKPIQP
jgi:hypothetical protein